MKQLVSIMSEVSFQLTMQNITVLLFLALVGCKDTNDGRYSYKIIDGKKQKFVDGDDLVPPMPDSDLNDETLAGVDSDGDGIRDDVEIWINEEADIASGRVALKMIAKNLSLAIVNYENSVKTNNLMQEKNKASNCMFKIYMNDHEREYWLIDSVYERVVNNNERTRAYLKMDKSLSGSAFHINTTNPCEEAGIRYE